MFEKMEKVYFEEKMSILKLEEEFCLLSYGKPIAIYDREKNILTIHNDVAEYDLTKTTSKHFNVFVEKIINLNLGIPTKKINIKELFYDKKIQF